MIFLLLIRFLLLLDFTNEKKNLDFVLNKMNLNQTINRFKRERTRTQINFNKINN